MPSPAEVAARGVASEPVSDPGIFDDIQGFLRLAGTDSITAAVPTVAEAGAVTVEVAGEATATLGLWPIVLILLLTLCTLRVMENAIIYPFGLVPWKGGDIQRIVRSGFRWLDNFENAVIGYIVHQIEALMKAALTLFTFMLGITLPRVLPAPQTPPSNHTGYATEAQVTYLQQEINNLKQAVGTMEIELQPNFTPTGAGTATGPLPPTTTTNTQIIKVGVPQTVWDQIHHLEAQMSQRITSIDDLYARVDRLTNISTSLQHEFATLTGEIHAVRAVSASWQDMQQQLEALGSLTIAFIDETAADLGKLTAVQTHMQPLGLLLEPGIRGLRNLRKLEDNICQCPKFGTIPNELGTALAVLEFVENG